MGQKELVLSVLKRHWPEPVHSHTFRKEYGVGDPSKRVCELKDDGHDIRTEVARRNGRHGVLIFLRQHEYDAVPSTGNFPSSPGGTETAGRASRKENPRRLSPAASPLVAAGHSSKPVDRDLLFSMCAHVSRTERKLKTEGKEFTPRTLEDCIALVDRVGEQTEMEAAA